MPTSSDIQELLNVITGSRELTFRGIATDNPYSRLRNFLISNREPLRSLDENSLRRLLPLLQNGSAFLQKNATGSQYSAAIRGFIPRMSTIAEKIREQLDQFTQQQKQSPPPKSAPTLQQPGLATVAVAAAAPPPERDAEEKEQQRAEQARANRQQRLADQYQTITSNPSFGGLTEAQRNVITEVQRRLQGGRLENAALDEITHQVGSHEELLRALIQRLKEEKEAAEILQVRNIKASLTSYSHDVPFFSWRHHIDAAVNTIYAERDNNNPVKILNTLANKIGRTEGTLISGLSKVEGMDYLTRSLSENSTLKEALSQKLNLEAERVVPR